MCLEAGGSLRVHRINRCRRWDMRLSNGLVRRPCLGPAGKRATRRLTEGVGQKPTPRLGIWAFIFPLRWGGKLPPSIPGTARCGDLAGLAGGVEASATEFERESRWPSSVLQHRTWRVVRRRRALFPWECPCSPSYRGFADFANFTARAPLARALPRSRAPFHAAASYLSSPGPPRRLHGGADGSDQRRECG